jgi:redox-sensitive bicupin YhaK (pirin superfamily)
MGALFGKKSPVPQFSDTVYADMDLQAGSRIPIPADIEERALYALSGTLEIGGISHAPMQLLILRPGDEITITAQTDCRVMLLGGAAMDGPRHIWWNFVSSRKDRIEQAKQDWAQGRFEKVPGEHEFIPLPSA